MLAPGRPEYVILFWLAHPRVAGRIRSGGMSYKVFLVEDEIVTREGIRDNVDWKSAGFELCGEAPDGEIALPLIERAQPDVLITDIKMPFMDGLQLCKVVRSEMPWVKIIILSGHDEFDYAQTAIKLGVFEYLLKPITSAEIQGVLHNVAGVLDQEHEERANLKELQNQVKDVLALQKERLLLQLVLGGVSTVEAIEQCRRIGLPMIAQCYLVVLIRIDPPEGDGHLDFAGYQAIQKLAANLAGMHSGALFAQKSAEELLFILSGDDPEVLIQNGFVLAQL
jgi:two-component system response regulator YesN